jgi:hypothetical protein
MSLRKFNVIIVHEIVDSYGFEYIWLYDCLQGFCAV